jgi:iron complex outermembrane receptor protein
MAAALAAAALVGHLPGAMAQAALAAEAPQAFDLPAQPLGAALNELARQAQVQMSFPAAAVAGRTAPPVSGRLTLGQALERLLAGSGLRATVEGRAVLVQEAPVPQARSSELPAITVTAAPTPASAARQRERGYRVQRSTSAGLAERPVLDTPYSTTALSAELLADLQARSLVDFVKLEPSVTLNFPTFDDSVNIRGFDVSMAHRDGFRISRQVRTPLENKSSVEFLRGLSGFRYGFNDVGGVVSYTVKRPTDAPLTSVTLRADSHGSVGAHVDVSRRFGPEQQFGVRLNAMAEEFESFMDNVEGPRRLLSLFADWRVTRELTLELDVETFRDERPSPSLSLWAFGSLDEARAILPSIQPHMSTAQPWFTEDRDARHISARAEYRFSPQWKGTLAWMRSRSSVPYGGLDANAVQANGDYSLTSYYIEDNVSRNNGLLASLTGTYQLAGLKNELALAYSLSEDRNRGSDALLLALGTANLFRSQVLPEGYTVADNYGPWAQEQERRAFIVNNILHLDERWQLFTGLTFARLKSENPLADQARYDDSDISPTLALLHKITPRTSLYVSYATGLEQGGTAGTQASNAGRVMPALESRQWELGAKHELGDNGLLTLAAFEIDKGLEYINAAGAYVQDGRQVHRGLEATLAGNLGRDLRLSAGVTWLHPKIREAAENVGKLPPGVPRLQAGVFADWHLPALAPRLHLTGSVQASSKRHVNGANTFSVPGYAVFGLGARYSHGWGEQRLTYRLGVDNLFDKRYFNSVGAYEGLYFGATRTVTASVTVEF